MPRCPTTPSTVVSSLVFLMASLLTGSLVGSQTPPHDRVASEQNDSTVVWLALPIRPDSTPLAQLAAATRAARLQGRTPIVELGAPWCGPCQVLEVVLRSPEMRAAMSHMYVISLNTDLWGKALVNLGFDATTGIPRMIMIDSTGHAVGEPWRPRDVPDSLTQELGNEGAWRVTLTDLFVKARQQDSTRPTGSPPSSRPSGPGRRQARS